MKILLVNHHLEDFAGSETFTYTLAKTLRLLGKQVEIYSPFLGEIAEKLKKEGFLVTDSLDLIKKRKIDSIHASHNISAIQVRSALPDVPMVYFVHGILPELEQLPTMEINIAKFVCVSEEIANRLGKKYKIGKKDIEIVRNLIDINRFKSFNPINRKLKNVLVISNHFSGEWSENIKKVCEILSLNLNIIGVDTKPVDDVENYINKADLVVSLGRGCLESMSCERVVLVYDIHGGDGIVTNKSYYEIRKNNFSGRRYSYKFSIKELISEFKKYDPIYGKIGRELVIKYHDAEDRGKQLLNIYTSAQGTHKRIFKKRNTALLRENTEFSFYQETIKTFKSKVNEKGEEIKGLKNELKNIYNSRSWKLVMKLKKLKRSTPFINKL